MKRLVEVRKRVFALGRPLKVEILVPPYPCAGVGTLRAVRVFERPGDVAVVATYEGYVRM